MTAQSIYIHIPFCKTKCPYCDFASWAGKEHLIECYIDALISEVRTKCEAYCNWHCHYEERSDEAISFRETSGDCFVGLCPPRNDKPTIKTIFIGGGTPSLIAPEYYEKVFSEFRKYFEIREDCEITLEVNPGTARDDYLREYKKLGINRISIGAQSFNESILQTLGRGHSTDETRDTVGKVKNAGFENFNLDLIYSVPGMTKEIWRETINETLDLEPKHISAYSLIIEPGTPFEQIYKNPKSLPEDDFTFELYLELCEKLNKAEFVHYEISNFAKDSYTCRHNLVYWNQEEYFAFGVSAHRFLNGLRTCNTSNLQEYISFPNLEKIIDFPINSSYEKIMLSSRLKQGVDFYLLTEVSNKPRQKITQLLETMSQEGLLELSQDKIHLTEKGMFLNNEILLRLT